MSGEPQDPILLNDDEDETDTESVASDEYIVEAIRARREDSKTGATEWLVKWKGFPEEASTWEPTKHLKCPQEVHDFFMRELNERQKAHMPVSIEPGNSAAPRERPKKSSQS